MKSLSIGAFGNLSFGTLFLLSTLSVHAQSTPPGSGQQEKTVMVTYLGTQEDLLVFNVSYDNPEGVKFLVTLKDQDGTQLYQHYYTDKSFFKQFMVPKADNDKIVFTIRNGQEAALVKTFEIKVDSHYIREIAIRKF
jgi:hypothetical protein